MISAKRPCRFPQLALIALVLGTGALAGAFADATPPTDAVVSPDGMRAVWVKDDGSGFWLAARTSPGGSWEQPSQITIRGVVRRPVFSPNGRRFAFENARGGYSTQDPNIWGPNRAFTWGYIVIFDFASRRISYVNPSFAEDTDPNWSGNERISYTRHIEGVADAHLTSPIAPPPAAPQTDDTRHKAMLEALLTAPLLYQPTRAADGNSLAFVARAGRERAVYFMRVGELARKRVSYADDDGQTLSGVAVSPHGSLIAYVRGGERNGKGEIANPLSLTEAPQQQIWLADMESSAAPRLVGSGASPQFSPDGARLLWETERGVASLPLIFNNDRAQAKESVEFILPGSLSHLRFSPDGKRVTFERSSYVEIYDLQTRDQWAIAKPAEAADSDPSWSPDGRSVAFRRVWGRQPQPNVGFDGNYVAEKPWAIQVADTATHQVRQVWRAATGMGSAYYSLDQDPTDAGALQDDLFWSNSNQIGFVWERDGWRHLYAVSADGGAARLLTPGDGEVEQVAVSLDRNELIYSSNIGDLPRRHLWKVAFGGGAPESLTRATDSQWAPTPMADKHVAFIQGGWKTPPALMLADVHGIIASGAPVVQPSFPASSMVEPQPVTFPGTDGQQAYGQLFAPREPSGCGVIFVHGGIRRQMLLGFHYMDAYSNLYELNQYFAIRGCAVLSVEYRSSIMRGYGYRNAPGWGNAGASEYRDVLGGARYLKSRNDLHVRSIGIYGLSWGGYLTAQALARNSDVFQVGFDMAGVHEFPAASFKDSPAAFVEQWRSPVYIAAGDDDRNVDFNQSIMLIRALHRQAPRVQVVERVVPNEIHDLSLTFEDLVDVYWHGSEFMLQHLMGR